ncbi:MAG: hypothetical protein ACTSP0_08555, partial [Alphaproteobacteria bacterium]
MTSARFQISRQLFWKGKCLARPGIHVNGSKFACGARFTGFNLDHLMGEADNFTPHLHDLAVNHNPITRMQLF